LMSDVVLKAQLFRSLGIEAQDRVAILLPNSLETVIAAFATSYAGCMFVPINTILRRAQIAHILDDCGAKILVTTAQLYRLFESMLGNCRKLNAVVITDQSSDVVDHVTAVQVAAWNMDIESPLLSRSFALDTTKPAAIFYTSGSTGKAKGVVISHANLVAGAQIVARYLGNSESDRILAALPLSFDYGFSQVTTAFSVGAHAILTNYFLPQTLLNDISTSRATGLAGVPTMWSQIATTHWPKDAAESIRYISNSGGKLSTNTIRHLRKKIPTARIYLMYGLTESFRSTYLDPKQVDSHPTSIGKAIPGVNIAVVDANGEECPPGVPGELVHGGALVSLGYWNNKEATARRFRPFPKRSGQKNSEQVAVWSGDTVRADNAGYLYFIERSDAMIKASGYRISPSEIEDVIQGTGYVQLVVAVGMNDDMVGQRVAVAIVPKLAPIEIERIRRVCAEELPFYMQPTAIQCFSELPLSPNGKPDRQAIRSLFG
jgi:acyl-CoA ligase (AMP-forming) (exosortase A-associated)